MLLNLKFRTVTQERCVNNYDRFYLFAKSFVIMCLISILKRWRATEKTAILV